MNAAFYSPRDLAPILGVSSKTVFRLARREGWAELHRGNRSLFAPPSPVVAAAGAAGVKSAALPSRADAQRAGRELMRAAAVFDLRFLLAEETPIELALLMVAKFYRWKFSSSALRRWNEAVTRDGLAGLIERPRPGRPKK